MKKYFLIIGFFIIALIFWYITSLHKDRVIPFIKYYPEVDSLRFINGSSLFYFAKLDTIINKDTLVIAVYGRLPIFILNEKEEYGTFEKAHVKKIKLPKNIKYIRWEDKLIMLKSLTTNNK